MHYGVSRKKHQHGFSLLEVIVSILVLTVGALGAAGMQVAALKDTGSAGNRYRAASFANGMADAMRADRTQAVKGGSEFAAALAAGSCAGADIQAVKRWQNEIACDLPSSKGGVVINTFFKRALITVEWDDSRGNGGAAAQQFTLEVRL